MIRKLLILLALTISISCQDPTPVPDAATAKLLLDLHNAERNAIGVVPLRWSDSLAQASQTWANYLASTSQFKHSGTAWVGENIAQATYRSNMPAFMFSQWSSQKKYFNPTARFGSDSSIDPTKEVGHYTQVIWSMSFEVGCGIANKTSMGVLVCQYSYSGNFVGNWVYRPDPNNPWKAAQPVVNPAAMPPPPAPNSQPELLDQESADRLLKLHNAERAFVGMKPVTWSAKLAAQAQAHANKQAKAGTFYKSGTPYTGENMQKVTIGPNMVDYMFNMWANEKIYFDATLRYPTCAIGNKMISHYTQVVWSATKEIGCGMATSSKNCILVCQYTLAGNYRGNFVVYPAPKVNFDFTLNP